MALFCGVVGLAFSVTGAAAEPLRSDRCRTLSVLRFKGDLFFHHRLSRRGRSSADAWASGSSGPVTTRQATTRLAQVAVPVFALKDVRTTVALAPGRRQVVFYNPYFCSPRLSETQFLRCLRRR